MGRVEEGVDGWVARADDFVNGMAFCGALTTFVEEVEQELVEGTGGGGGAQRSRVSRDRAEAGVDDFSGVGVFGFGSVRVWIAVGVSRGKGTVGGV